MIRLFHCDDSDAMRLLVREQFGPGADVEVVGDATDPASAVSGAKRAPARRRPARPAGSRERGAAWCPSCAPPRRGRGSSSTAATRPTRPRRPRRRRRVRREVGAVQRAGAGRPGIAPGWPSTSCATIAPSATSRTRPSRRAKRPRANKAELPRFVIQEHSATRLHWDLRLEHDGALASWAIPNGLPEAPKDNRLAVRTEDHPLEYLTSTARSRRAPTAPGPMTIWDQGTYELLKWERAQDRGAPPRRAARCALRAVRRSSREDPPKDWMIHRMDPAADPDREPMPEQLAADARARRQAAARRRALGL